MSSQIFKARGYAKKCEIASEKEFCFLIGHGLEQPTQRKPPGASENSTASSHASSHIICVLARSHVFGIFWLWVKVLVRRQSVRKTIPTKNELVIYVFNIFIHHTHLRKYLHHSSYHFELHSLSQLRHASPDNKS